jgi:thiol-disulfide isomerase/thioredoxin
MPYLAAAVVLVGVIAVLDLLLTVGVVRRLREQADALRELRQASDSDADVEVILPAGRTVAEFSAGTVSGRTLSRDGLTGTTLVGFFSPHCEPCRDQLPDFLAYAAGFDGAVVAVAAGEPAETASLVAELAAVAEVVTQPENGPLEKAFGVRGYPALCLVEPDGRVLAGGYGLDALPVPTGA